MPYKNPEEKRANDAAYRSLHREEIKSYHAAYRASHAKEFRAYKAAWRASHVAQKDIADALYRATHRAQHRAADTAWANAHPEKKREIVQRRRALLRGRFVEKIEMAVIVERDGGHCGICHKPVAETDRSIDHVLPISRGGAHSYANTRLSHLVCNIKRNNRGAAQLRLVG